MESVDGDVRLSVKLDTKTIQSSADELRKAFKNALSSLSSSDAASKVLGQLDTAVQSVTNSLKTLQSSGNVTIQTNAQQIAEETEQVSSAIGEVQSNAETANQALSEMENINANTEPIEQVTEAVENLDEWARQTDEDIDKLFDDLFAQQQTAGQNVSQQAPIVNADNFQADFVASEFNDLLSQINNVEELQELIMDLRTVQGQLNSESEDYNEKWESIDEAVHSVLEKIREVRTENAKAAAATNEITQNTEQLENATEQVVNAVEQTDNTQQIEQIANNAERTNEILTNVQTAESGVSQRFQSMATAISSASDKIIQFNKNILNSVKSLIQHAKASKAAKNGINNFNSVIKKGIRALLKYGLGIRSTYILINKLRSAVKEGYKNLAGYSDEVNQSISSVLSSLAKLKNQLAATFQPIVSVAVPTLNKLIEKLNESAFAISQFFAALTGQTVVYKANDVQKQYVENLEDTAEAAEEAEKALDNYLSPLDDLNKYEEPKEVTPKVTESKTDDNEDPKKMFETVAVENKFLELAKKIKEELSKLFAPIKNSWDKYGATVIEKVKGTFNSLKSTIGSVHDSFVTVWTGGTGESIVDNILQTFININSIITNISDNFRTAWDSGSGLSIAQKLADTFNIILTHINNITAKTAEWSKDINFGPLLNSLDEISTPLQGIIDLAGEWTEKVWEKVFLPLASWTIEKAVPAALDAISGALELIESVGEKAGEILGDLWDGFFAQAASWVGDKIVSFLEILSQFLTDVANNDAAVTAIIAIGAAILTIVTAVKALNIALAIADILSQPLLILPTLIAIAIGAIIVVIIELITYWDSLKEIFSEGVQWWGNLFSDWWNTIVTYWSDKLLKIANWFKTVTASFKEFIGDIKDYWGNLFKSLWNSVKNWWNNTFIAGWKQFLNGAWNGLKNWWNNTFIGGWNSALATVKNAFSNMWNGIKNIAKNAINAVIGWINSLISGIVSKINNVLSLMNSLSFDIPDWLGGGTLGFNVPLINAPQIPYLATGAVIPPNRQFLAVLGDQKNGNNIEAPESLIRQIVSEELAKNNGGNNVYNVNLQVGNKSFLKFVLDEAKIKQGQTGRNPFELA